MYYLCTLLFLSTALCLVHFIVQLAHLLRCAYAFKYLWRRLLASLVGFLVVLGRRLWSLPLLLSRFSANNLLWSDLCLGLLLSGYLAFLYADGALFSECLVVQCQCKCNWFTILELDIADTFAQVCRLVSNNSDTFNLAAVFEKLPQFFFFHIQRQRSKEYWAFVIVRLHRHESSELSLPYTHIHTCTVPLVQLHCLLANVGP